MKEIKNNLIELYGDDGLQVYANIKEYIKKVIPREKTSDRSYWYKNINVYVVYPDGLYSRTLSPFKRLISHLDHVKKLGFNAIHVLPFLASPMVDKGFDISDFHKVRPELGTFEELKQFKAAAEEKDIRVFMDLVFNHISEEHEWFKKAVAGDEYYREFFIYRKKKPRFIRRFHKESAVWAEYEVDGEIVIANIAFPEYTGEVPHWREGDDGYWYYHTYYPQQLDVNWFNPHVFEEFAKIVMDWASLGFNFRMDAIPFVGKDAYKQVDEDYDRTFKIIAALNAIADEIYPECAFIVETYERLETVKAYFGTSNMKQAELSYNFHLCTYLWVGLVTQNVDSIWGKLTEIIEIPKHGEWINFLRNHDELSLAYLDDDLNQKLNRALLPNGAPFREQYGISGRTYSLLGGTLKRFLMAYFLLYSIPGSIAMVYGDEFGTKNISWNKLNDKERKDTRNINRGVLTKSHMQTKKSKRICAMIEDMLNKRKILRHYQNIWPERIDKIKDKAIFAAIYKLGASELIVLINLSNKRKKVALECNDHRTVVTMNSLQVQGDQITLGPYGGVWLEK